MRASLSRRLVLGGLAGSALWRGGHAAEAAAHALTVGCWGGAYAAALRAVVDAPLATEAGVSVQQATSGEQERIARITAPGTQARLDVVLISDVDAYRLSLRQVFRPVTTAGVGDLPHVLPALRVPYGVPQAQTAMCVVYNPAKVRTAPRGFTALFEAARTGQAGFSSELAVHNLAAAAVTRSAGPASLEGAKSIFTALKKAGKLRLYPDNEALGQALASGEIAMAPMWRSRAYVWRQGGRELRCVTPVEGAIPFVILGCVPHAGAHTGGPQTGGPQTGGPQTGGPQTGGPQTGGPQTGGSQTGGSPTGGSPTAAAMLYLERLLRPDVQGEMARRLGLLPTVDTAHIDRKLLQQIGFTGAQRARFRPLSLDAVARNGVSLRQFWNHELA